MGRPGFLLVNAHGPHFRVETIKGCDYPDQPNPGLRHAYPLALVVLISAFIGAPLAEGGVGPVLVPFTHY